MYSPNQNIALVLFTRTPQEESAHKNILNRGKAHKQKRLFALLVQHAQLLGQQTGLPFFVVDSRSQHGGTFGERLQNTFTGFFAQGFTKVIAIGNDCVQLKANEIIEAACQLQNNQAVFGPAHDGGVYLLGLDQTLFQHKTGFSEINWQTSTVLTELENWCFGCNMHLLSQVYADLDNWQELQAAYMTEQLPFTCRALLAGIFTAISYYINRFTYRFNILFVSSYSFRGPPVF